MPIEPISESLVPSSDSMVQTMTMWQENVGKSLLLGCFYHWEMLVLMQRVMDASQREFRDEWTSRFGGGIPLDG